jgi:arylsulfatase A-like enzyme
VSLLPLFLGESTLTRERLFWHFPCYVGKAAPSSAIREGDFKLIEFFEEGGYVELYNLRDDPGEQSNLAQQHPDIANRLHRTLQDWQQQTSASMPRGQNPQFDPQAERPRGGTQNQEPRRNKTNR